MKKKLSTIVLLSTALGVSTITVSAKTNFLTPVTSSITENTFATPSPYYQNIRDVIAHNTRNGNSLHMYTNIITTRPVNISLTTKLEKYKNGKWTTVKTWSSQKSSSIDLTLSKTYTITKGYKYRTCSTFKCGNEQGKKYSNIISY